MVVTFFGDGDMEYLKKNNMDKKLYAEIKNLMQSGGTTFVFGGCSDFDLMCAQIVKELQDKFPNVVSILVLPYEDFEFDKSLYNLMHYFPFKARSKRTAILHHNFYMVFKTDAIVYHVKNRWSISAKAIRYARRDKYKMLISIK